MARRNCKFELRQQDDIVPNDESMPSNMFFVKFCTWIRTLNHDIRTLNHDEEIDIDYNRSRLIQEETFWVQCEQILCDFKGAMPHICSWLFQMRIPSELQLGIAKKIHCFANSMVNEPHNTGRKVLPILMNFTTLWFCPTHLLVVPLEDPMQKATPTTKTSIDALEKVRLEGLDLPTKCVICLEEFSTEVEVTRMSCSHVYHENCIIQWLKKSHLCPLCRFEMPTI